MNHGKRYRAAAELARRAGLLRDLKEAVSLVKQTAHAKFDETIVISSHLGVDPRHSDQLVRGTVVLPHGTGKSLRVLVLCKGDKVKDATAAGADFAGAEEYIQKIQGGWLDVDAIVATPDMMGEVGKLGKILGPRGLMPNPKSGTVTFDIAKAVRELKAGKIEFRVDKGSNVHAPVGKASFSEADLLENARTFLRELVRARPAAAKGHYIMTLAMSATMGPAVTLDPAKILADFAKEHERPAIKAAVVNGRLFDAKAIAVLATLPSYEVLLAQVLSTFIAPMTQFLAAIDATLRLPATMAQVLEQEKSKSS